MSAAIANKWGDPEINTIHLLLAILTPKDYIWPFFERAGILFSDIIQACGKPVFEKFAPPPPRPTDQLSVISRLLAPASSRKKIAQNEYSLSLHHFTFESYDDSIAACRKGLAAMPDDLRLLNMLSFAYLRKFEYQLANAALKKILEIDPNEINARINLAFTYEKLKEQQRAQDIYDQLLQEFPDNSTILNNAGFSLSQQNKHDRAVVLFEKATHIDPDFAFAWDNLGFSNHRLGRSEQGYAQIEHSLSLDKGNSYAYKYIARLNPASSAPSATPPAGQTP